MKPRKTKIVLDADVIIHSLEGMMLKLKLQYFAHLI